MGYFIPFSLLILLLTPGLGRPGVFFLSSNPQTLQKTSIEFTISLIKIKNKKKG